MRDEDRSRWTRLVADFESVDLSQREFAQERGISLSNLRYWIYKLRKEARPLVAQEPERSDQAPEHAAAAGPSRLLPVRVVASAAKRRQSRVEVLAADDVLLELALPSGATLRFPAGTDLAYLRALVVLPEAKVWAEIDATRVTQMLGNLLHNSAKYTHQGDEVTVLLAVDTNTAEIRVSDTGEGIDGALLPAVFETFTQGPRALARSRGGLGLGLSMVKGLAELHGGTVCAESAGVGQGAAFILRLPLASEQAPRPAVPAEEPGSFRRRRVLLVDDNRDAAESLAELLGVQGNIVDVAYDGPSALEKAQANPPPTVVLCDIGLPGMSGYEVAKALRAVTRSPLKLVAVSGYAQPEDVKRAIDAGFDVHVAKPCSSEVIERLLR